MSADTESQKGSESHIYIEVMPFSLSEKIVLQKRERETYYFITFWSIVTVVWLYIDDSVNIVASHTVMYDSLGQVRIQISVSLSDFRWKKTHYSYWN